MLKIVSCSYILLFTLMLICTLAQICVLNILTQILKLQQLQSVSFSNYEIKQLYYIEICMQYTIFVFYIAILY